MRESRHFDLRVPARPEMASRVRRALERLDLPPEVLDDAKLLASELVSNSIRHAGLQPDDRVRVRSSWSGSRLRVDVHDGAEMGAPPPIVGSIRPAPGAQSGWGLYLVDCLASRWGAAPGRYWFELEWELQEGADGG